MKQGYRVNSEGCIVDDGDLSIDPWSSTQSTDYSRIIDQFGLSSLTNLTLPNPSHLHRRGIVFAHRDLDLVLQAQRTGDNFGVLTGLMPNGFRILEAMLLLP